jgi:hypothetical protein
MALIVGLSEAGGPHPVMAGGGPPSTPWLLPAPTEGVDADLRRHDVAAFRSATGAYQQPTP